MDPPARTGLIQTCAELGVAFPFSPLARGAFGPEGITPATLSAGDFRLSIPRFQDPHWQLNQPRLAALRAYAADRGLTSPALALAWILDQGQHLIPIPGTRTAENLADWAGAADLTLTEEDRATLARLMPFGWSHGDRYGPEQRSTVEHSC